jgi:hypothetical protein
MVLASPCGPALGSKVKKKKKSKNPASIAALVKIVNVAMHTAIAGWYN